MIHDNYTIYEGHIFVRLVDTSPMSLCREQWLDGISDKAGDGRPICVTCAKLAKERGLL